MNTENWAKEKPLSSSDLASRLPVYPAIEGDGESFLKRDCDDFTCEPFYEDNLNNGVSDSDKFQY